MSDNGISTLRNRKAARAARQAPPPRHPKPPPAAEAVTSGSGEVAAPVIVAAVPAAEAAQIESPRPQAPAEALPVPPVPSASPAPDAAAPVGIVPPADKPLPDLTIDWADPLMHVASPTRVSVANSVASRFKSAAEQPGSPPQTELIMEAVSQHLAVLPELVLKRRPEEAAPAAAGFFVRRAPVQKAEPWQPVYMRPIAGEIEALRRIVDWVNEVILDGHPGRQKTSRSEVVTAALDASYPAAS